MRLLVARVVRQTTSKSLFSAKFTSNAGVIMIKKQSPASKYLSGPITRMSFTKRKLASLFKKTI